MFCVSHSNYRCIHLRVDNLPLGDREQTVTTLSTRNRHTLLGIGHILEVSVCAFLLIDAHIFILLYYTYNKQPAFLLVMYINS